MGTSVDPWAVSDDAPKAGAAVIEEPKGVEPSATKKQDPWEKELEDSYARDAQRVQRQSAEDAKSEPRKLTFEEFKANRPQSAYEGVSRFLKAIPEGWNDFIAQAKTGGAQIAQGSKEGTVAGDAINVSATAVEGAIMAMEQWVNIVEGMGSYASRKLSKAVGGMTPEQEAAEEYKRYSDVYDESMRRAKGYSRLGDVIRSFPGDAAQAVAASWDKQVKQEAAGLMQLAVDPVNIASVGSGGALARTAGGAVKAAGKAGLRAIAGAEGAQLLKEGATEIGAKVAGLAEKPGVRVVVAGAKALKHAADEPVATAVKGVAQVARAGGAALEGGQRLLAKMAEHPAVSSIAAGALTALQTGSPTAGVIAGLSSAAGLTAGAEHLAKLAKTAGTRANIFRNVEATLMGAARAHETREVGKAAWLIAQKKTQNRFANEALGKAGGAAMGNRFAGVVGNSLRLGSHVAGATLDPAVRGATWGAIFGAMQDQDPESAGKMFGMGLGIGAFGHAQNKGLMLGERVRFGKKFGYVPVEGPKANVYKRAPLLMSKEQAQSVGRVQGKGGQESDTWIWNPVTKEHMYVNATRGFVNQSHAAYAHMDRAVNDWISTLPPGSAQGARDAMKPQKVMRLIREPDGKVALREMVEPGTSVDSMYRQMQAAVLGVGAGGAAGTPNQNRATVFRHSNVIKAMSGGRPGGFTENANKALLMADRWLARNAIADTAEQGKVILARQAELLIPEKERGVIDGGKLTEEQRARHVKLIEDVQSMAKELQATGAGYAFEKGRAVGRGTDMPVAFVNTDSAAYRHDQAAPLYHEDLHTTLRTVIPDTEELLPGETHDDMVRRVEASRRWEQAKQDLMSEMIGSRNADGTYRVGEDGLPLNVGAGRSMEEVNAHIVAFAHDYVEQIRRGNTPEAWAAIESDLKAAWGANPEEWKAETILSHPLDGIDIGEEFAAEHYALFHRSAREGAWERAQRIARPGMGDVFKLLNAREVLRKLGFENITWGDAQADTIALARELAEKGGGKLTPGMERAIAEVIALQHEITDRMVAGETDMEATRTISREDLKGDPGLAKEFQGSGYVRMRQKTQHEINIEAKALFRERNGRDPSPEELGMSAGRYVKEFAIDPETPALRPTGEVYLMSDAEVRKQDADRTAKIMEVMGTLGEDPDPRALHLTISADGKPRYDGRYLSERQLTAIEALPNEVVSAGLKHWWRIVSEFARDPANNGVALQWTYYAATKDGRYSSRITQSFRIANITSMAITKAANFTVNTFDFGRIEKALRRAVEREPDFLVPWGGGVNAGYEQNNKAVSAFVEDMELYTQNHERGVPSLTGMEGDAARKAGIINDFFNIKDKETRDLKSGEFAVFGKNRFYAKLRMDRLGEVGASGASLFGRRARLPIDLYRQKHRQMPDVRSRPSWEWRESALAEDHGWWLKSRKLVEARFSNEGTTDQLEGMLRNAGVSDDEMFWSGLRDFIRENAGQKVSKKAVLEAIDDAGFDVEEVYRGNPNEERDITEALRLVGAFNKANSGYVAEIDLERPREHGRHGAERTSMGFTVRKKGGGFVDYTWMKQAKGIEMLDRVSAIADRVNGVGYASQGAGSYNYPDMKLAGGRGYFELVLRNADDGGPRPSEDISNHWSMPRVLASVRAQSYATAEGKRVLLLDEVQSDFWQANRNNNADQVASHEKTWPRLAMRRMVQWAATHGYDAIAWTPAEVQIRRWTPKGVKRIEVLPSDEGNGLFDVVGWKKDDYAEPMAEGTKTGISPEQVAKYIGEERYQEWEGGGREAMDWSVEPGESVLVNTPFFETLYDRVLPQEAAKVGKEFGMTVGRGELPVGETGWTVTKDGKQLGNVPDGHTREQAIVLANRVGGTVGYEGHAVNVHMMDVTKQARDVLASRGFPVFMPDIEPTADAGVNVSKRIVEGLRDVDLGTKKPGPDVAEALETLLPRLKNEAEITSGLEHIGSGTEGEVYGNATHVWKVWEDWMNPVGVDVLKQGGLYVRFGSPNSVLGLMRRLALHNEAFPDAPVVPVSFVVDEKGYVQVVTKGLRFTAFDDFEMPEATAESLIEEGMGARGFDRVKMDEYRFWNPETGMVVTDAHASNFGFRQTGGFSDDVVPLDLVMSKLTKGEATALKRIEGVQMPDVPEAQSREEYRNRVAREMGWATPIEALNDDPVAYGEALLGLRTTPGAERRREAVAQMPDVRGLVTYGDDGRMYLYDFQTNAWEQQLLNMLDAHGETHNIAQQYEKELVKRRYAIPSIKAAVDAASNGEGVSASLHAKRVQAATRLLKNPSYSQFPPRGGLLEAGTNDRESLAERIAGFKDGHYISLLHDNGASTVRDLFIRVFRRMSGKFPGAEGAEALKGAWDLATQGIDTERIADALKDNGGGQGERTEELEFAIQDAAKIFGRFAAHAVWPLRELKYAAGEARVKGKNSSDALVQDLELNVFAGSERAARGALRATYLADAERVRALPEFAAAVERMRALADAFSPMELRGLMMAARWPVVANLPARERIARETGRGLENQGLRWGQGQGAALWAALQAIQDNPAHAWAWFFVKNSERDFNSLSVSSYTHLKDAATGMGEGPYGEAEVLPIAWNAEVVEGVKKRMEMIALADVGSAVAALVDEARAGVPRKLDPQAHDEHADVDKNDPSSVEFVVDMSRRVKAAYAKEAGSLTRVGWVGQAAVEALQKAFPDIHYDIWKASDPDYESAARGVIAMAESWVDGLQDDAAVRALFEQAKMDAEMWGAVRPEVIAQYFSSFTGMDGSIRKAQGGVQITDYALEVARQRSIWDNTEDGDLRNGRDDYGRAKYTDHVGLPLPPVEPIMQLGKKVRLEGMRGIANEIVDRFASGEEMTWKEFKEWHASASHHVADSEIAGGRRFEDGSVVSLEQALRGAFLSQEASIRYDAWSAIAGAINRVNRGQAFGGRGERAGDFAAELMRRARGTAVELKMGEALRQTQGWFGEDWHRYMDAPGMILEANAGSDIAQRAFVHLLRYGLETKGKDAEAFREEMVNQARLAIVELESGLTSEGKNQAWMWVQAATMLAEKPEQVAEIARGMVRLFNANRGAFVDARGSYDYGMTSAMGVLTLFGSRQNATEQLVQSKAANDLLREAGKQLTKQERTTLAWLLYRNAAGRNEELTRPAAGFADAVDILAKQREEQRLDAKYDTNLAGDRPELIVHRIWDGLEMMADEKEAVRQGKEVIEALAKHRSGERVDALADVDGDLADYIIDGVREGRVGIENGRRSRWSTIVDSVSDEVFARAFGERGAIAKFWPGEDASQEMKITALKKGFDFIRKHAGDTVRESAVVWASSTFGASMSVDGLASAVGSALGKAGTELRRTFANEVMGALAGDIERSLAALADMHRNRLVGVLEERMRRVRGLAEEKQFRDAIEEFNKADTPLIAAMMYQYAENNIKAKSGVGFDVLMRYVVGHPQEMARAFVDLEHKIGITVGEMDGYAATRPEVLGEDGKADAAKIMAAMEGGLEWAQEKGTGLYPVTSYQLGSAANAIVTAARWMKGDAKLSFKEALHKVLMDQAEKSGGTEHVTGDYEDGMSMHAWLHLLNATFTPKEIAAILTRHYTAATRAGGSRLEYGMFSVASTFRDAVQEVLRGTLDWNASYSVEDLVSEVMRHFGSNGALLDAAIKRETKGTAGALNERFNNPFLALALVHAPKDMFTRLAYNKDTTHFIGWVLDGMGSSENAFASEAATFGARYYDLYEGNPKWWLDVSRPGKEMVNFSKSALWSLNLDAEAFPENRMMEAAELHRRAFADVLGSNYVGFSHDLGERIGNMQFKSADAVRAVIKLALADENMGLVNKMLGQKALSPETLKETAKRGVMGTRFRIAGLIGAMEQAGKTEARWQDWKTWFKGKADDNQLVGMLKHVDAGLNPKTAVYTRDQLQKALDATKEGKWFLFGPMNRRGGQSIAGADTAYGLLYDVAVKGAAAEHWRKLNRTQMGSGHPPGIAFVLVHMEPDGKTAVITELQSDVFQKHDLDEMVRRGEISDEKKSEWEELFSGLQVAFAEAKKDWRDMGIILAVRELKNRGFTDIYMTTAEGVKQLGASPGEGTLRDNYGTIPVKLGFDKAAMDLEIKHPEKQLETINVRKLSDNGFRNLTMMPDRIGDTDVWRADRPVDDRMVQLVLTALDRVDPELSIGVSRGLLQWDSSRVQELITTQRVMDNRPTLEGLLRIAGAYDRSETAHKAKMEVERELMDRNIQVWNGKEFTRNPEQFGVMPDDTTNDTQLRTTAALAAVKARVGGDMAVREALSAVFPEARLVWNEAMKRRTVRVGDRDYETVGTMMSGGEGDVFAVRESPTSAGFVAMKRWRSPLAMGEFGIWHSLPRGAREVDLLRRIDLHNRLFPELPIEVVGFDGHEGSLWTSMDWIEGVPIAYTWNERIGDWMRDRGWEQHSSNVWKRREGENVVVAGDVSYRNVALEGLEEPFEFKVRDAILREFTRDDQAVSLARHGIAWQPDTKGLKEYLDRYARQNGVGSFKEMMLENPLAFGEIVRAYKAHGREWEAMRAITSLPWQGRDAVAGPMDDAGKRDRVRRIEKELDVLKQLFPTFGKLEDVVGQVTDHREGFEGKVYIVGNKAMKVWDNPLYLRFKSQQRVLPGDSTAVVDVWQAGMMPVNSVADFLNRVVAANEMFPWFPIEVQGVLKTAPGNGWFGTDWALVTKAPKAEEYPWIGWLQADKRKEIAIGMEGQGFTERAEIAQLGLEREGAPLMAADVGPGNTMAYAGRMTPVDVVAGIAPWEAFDQIMLSKMGMNRAWMPDVGVAKDFGAKDSVELLNANPLLYGELVTLRRAVEERAAREGAREARVWNAAGVPFGAVLPSMSRRFGGTWAFSEDMGRALSEHTANTLDNIVEANGSHAQDSTLVGGTVAGKWADVSGREKLSKYEAAALRRELPEDVANHIPAGTPVAFAHDVIVGAIGEEGAARAWKAAGFDGIKEGETVWAFAPTAFRRFSRVGNGPGKVGNMAARHLVSPAARQQITAAMRRDFWTAEERKGGVKARRRLFVLKDALRDEAVAKGLNGADIDVEAAWEPNADWVGLAGAWDSEKGQRPVITINMAKAREMWGGVPEWGKGLTIEAARGLAGVIAHEARHFVQDDAGWKPGAEARKKSREPGYKQMLRKSGYSDRDILAEADADVFVEGMIDARNVRLMPDTRALAKGTAEVPEEIAHWFEGGVLKDGNVPLIFYGVANEEGGFAGATLRATGDQAAADVPEDGWKGALVEPVVVRARRVKDLDKAAGEGGTTTQRAIQAAMEGYEAVSWTEKDGRKGWAVVNGEDVRRLTRRAIDVQAERVALMPDVVVWHNTDEAGIMGIEAIGGIPKASLAITAVGQMVEGYGQIKLLLKPEWADPEGGKPVKIFDRDVYSGRQPMPTHEIEGAQLRGLRERVNEAWDAALGDKVRRYTHDVFSYEDPRRGVEGNKARTIQDWSGSTRLWWFWKTQVLGEKVDIPTHIELANNAEPTETLKKAVAEGALDGVKDNNDVEHNPKVIELAKAIAREHAQGHEDLVPDFERRAVTYRNLENTWSDYLRMKRAEIEVDGHKMRLAKEEDLGGYDSERTRAFRKWVETQAGQIFHSPYVKVRGRKEHYTLANVVDAMGKKIRGKEGGALVEGLGRSAARGAREIVSRRALEKLSDQIAGYEGHKSDAEAASQEWFAATDDVLKKWRWFSGDNFGDRMRALDAASRATGRFLSSKRAKTPELARFALAAEEFDVSGLTGDELTRIADAMKRVGAVRPEYFEAKVTDAVKWEDVAAAIVPESTPEEVVAVLERRGVEVRRTKTEEEKRAAARELGEKYKLALRPGPAAAEKKVSGDEAIAD